jgi:hypothetical protein
LAASKSPPSAVTILSGIGATRFPSSSTRAWTMPTFSAGVHFNRDLDLWYGGGCWGYNHGAKQKKKVPRRTKKKNCVVRKKKCTKKKKGVVKKYKNLPRKKQMVYLSLLLLLVVLVLLLCRVKHFFGVV